MTVLVNYAMFSIDPEMMVNINRVMFEVSYILNSCWNLTGYPSFKEYFQLSDAQQGCSEACDGEQAAPWQADEGQSSLLW